MENNPQNKTFSDTQEFNQNKLIDAFNYKMVILAWAFKIISITMYE